MVSIDALRSCERSQWDYQTLQSILQPNGNSYRYGSTTLVEVINQLEQLPRITVLSAGAVAGLIDRGDIVRALVKAESDV
jgi:hypothetical protein